MPILVREPEPEDANEHEHEHGTLAERNELVSARWVEALELHARFGGCESPSDRG